MAKIRGGFVSNSSSSSFVAVGFDVTEFVESFQDNEQYDWIDKMYEQGFLTLGVDDGWDGHTVVKQLVRFDDYEGAEFSLRDIENIIAEMSKVRDSLGVKTEVKLYAGWRAT